MKQEPPNTIRLWREVEPKITEMMKAMGWKFNAAVNILLMRGLGFGDYEIEQNCHANMRKASDESAKRN